MDKPKIKTLRVFHFDERHNEKIPQLYREYDERGNKVKEISYSGEEEIVEEKIFTYDENNRLVEEKSHYAEDEVTQVTRYEYDEKGRISKSHKSYGEEGDEDTTFYSYDATGNIIEERTESSDGEIEHKETWKFDGAKLIENEVFDADGKRIEYSRFSYREKDALAEEIRYSNEIDQELKIIYDHKVFGKFPDTTVYNPAGKIVQRTRHTFDEKEQLVQEVTETVDLVVKKFTSRYSYDDKGNRVELSIVDKNENLISKIVYKHNEFNLLVEEVHHEEVIPGAELRPTKTLTEYEFYT